ncbi:hypothetical protein [Acinetobacter sp. Marseille-Q1623]|uniref:hypothetical protein n=1 Tax=Acinetobacter sp. Marseille-Q1623 TaxID=2697501 RepID=UPI00157A85B9|nr:hypothetical protein [Acinetobacter sp. Marseille-Q1623]
MLGDRAWMNLTQGKLNFKDKITVLKKFMLPATFNFAKSQFNMASTSHHLTRQEIKIPDTAIVKDALFELEQTHCQATILHSWRCYFWGVAIAQSKQWQFDDEIFLIASLLHDVALADPKNEYQSCQCFTFESALRSESICHRHDYPAHKSQKISDAICLHMNGYLDEKDHRLAKESLLLQQATAYDVIGSEAQYISHHYQTEILKHYPRTQFKTRFQDLMQQEAQRHPHARPAFMNAFGLKLMIQFNHQLK